MPSRNSALGVSLASPSVPLMVVHSFYVLEVCGGKSVTFGENLYTVWGDAGLIPSLVQRCSFLIFLLFV